MVSTGEGGVQSGGFGRSMLGRVRTGQSHSLWWVSTAMLQSRNDEISEFISDYRWIWLPPCAEQRNSVLHGSTGEVAELLKNLRPRAELSMHCAQTLFLHLLRWFPVKVFFLKSFLSQKHHLGANFILAQGEMKQVGRTPAAAHLI